ncbi:MAG TPA: hypothetical protein VMD30_10070 [Tepidisphaeraceae bacterium]|nr:hypothetical protein [Tepidisphaeraceae bacterium]
MAGFYQWIGHRKELVGFQSWIGFCRAAGIHRSRISLLQAGTSGREVFGEYELRRIADLLHASYRRMRELADGQVDWIDDAHWVGEAQPARVPPWRRGISGGDAKRTAAIGRILPSGLIELEENWNAEFGPWISARVGSGRGTFALKLMPFDPDYPLERWMIFRLVRRDMLPDRQDVALFTFDGIAGRGLFGRLNVVGDSIVLRLQDARRQVMEIPRGQIMQLARVVGHFADNLAAGNTEKGLF